MKGCLQPTDHGGKVLLYRGGVGSDIAQREGSRLQELDEFETNRFYI